MSAPTPDPTTPNWRSYEETHHHVACYVVGPSEHVERIARRAFDHGECVWHASHVVYGELYDEQAIPTDVCSLCGGRNRADAGDHSLCTARHDRDRPTPRLDVVDARVCECHNCRRDRGER